MQFVKMNQHIYESLNIKTKFFSDFYGRLSFEIRQRRNKLGRMLYGRLFMPVQF